MHDLEENRVGRINLGKKLFVGNKTKYSAYVCLSPTFNKSILKSPTMIVSEHYLPSFVITGVNLLMKVDI